MHRKALLVVNAFLDSPSFAELREDFVSAAKRQGLSLSVATNADFLDPASLTGLPKKILFWDKDVRLAALLEQQGARLYNPARAIALCDDKALTWLALRPHGLPMPRTLLCPLSFPGVGYGRADFLASAAKTLGLPFVIKEVYGSFGQQVYLARTLSEAGDILEKTRQAPLVFQEFVAPSAGRDVRVYVAGGRVCAAMLRENLAGDFRANAALGARASAHRLSPEEEALALAACEKLGLDFAGVDLLFGADGPLLCEVNSNAHFRALKAATGVNPADSIIALLAGEDV